MKRRFTVDASKKIQASPVDFSLFDAFKGNDPEEIKSVLEANEDSLSEYYNTKISEVIGSVNADIKQILNSYIDRNYFDDFLNLVSKSADTKPLASKVLEHIYYDTISDPNYVMVEMNPGIKIDLMEITSSLWMDDALDDLWEHLPVSFPFAEDFIPALIYMLTQKEFVNQITPDDAVSICEELIYEFTSVVEQKFSTILEKATIEYLKNNR